MTLETLLALLQLGDGLFPAGGFAHSFGLETYTQEGRVRDRVGLEAFVSAHLDGAAGPGDAVAVAVAVRLAAVGDVGPWCELDARLEAMKPVPEPPDGPADRARCGRARRRPGVDRDRARHRR